VRGRAANIDVRANKGGAVNPGRQIGEVLEVRSEK
jgi:hypothetical protein